MNEFFEVLDRLKVHFNHHVVKKGKEAPFWVALSFTVTFGIVRYITYSIRKKNLATRKHPQAAQHQQHHSGFGFHDIEIGGIHLHHMVPGIILTLVAGYLALVTGEKAKKPVSIMYGSGAALALDEFALWLELRDVYWAKDGRKSFDAVAIAGALFVGGYALSEFGGAIIRDIHSRVTTGKYPPHHYDPADLPPDIDLPPEPLPTPQPATAAANSKTTPPRRAANQG